MNITTVLIEGTGGGSAFHSDPRVPHGALCIILSVFQLAKIRFYLLRGVLVTVASLKSIQRDRDVPGLSAPVAFRVNRPEGSGWLLDDSPWAGVGDGQFPVGRGFRGNQPYLFARVNGILLIPISAGAALEGPGELSLDYPVSFELVVLQPVNVAMGCQGECRGNDGVCPAGLQAPFRRYR